MPKLVAISDSSAALHGVVEDAAASLAQAWSVPGDLLQAWIEPDCVVPTQQSDRRWKLRAMMDGAMPSAVATSIARSERREHGVFFTPEGTAARMVRRLAIDAKLVCFDPTVGVGSLLLAYAARLPRRQSFEATLSLWNERLAGFDVNPHLVALAKLRILSLLTALVGAPSRIPGQDPLPHIKTGDALREVWPEWDVVLSNPPFAREVIDGRLTSQAAVFLERICDALKANREAVVLLPDVIRCGTQHAGLRHRIRRELKITWGAHLGRVWPEADIDVFAMHLTRAGRPNVGWWGDVPYFGDATTRRRLREKIAGETLGERFDVSVGAIVPHRHSPARSARSYPFVRASDLHWPLIPSRLGTVRCDASSTVQGPFLAVARTSSPSDSTRVVASIAPLAKPYAVENHILIINGRPLPELRKLKTCLESPAIRQLLDTRIGCRHITVGALKDMPVPRAKRKG